MRFHIPAIPHTVTNQQYLSCAYTQKVYKLCAMLKKMGHEIYHYGCEGSNPECTENVNIVSDEFRQKFYPTNYHTEQFRFDTNDKYHEVFYKNCVDEIKKRQQPKDFLLCAWGWGHEPIARHFDNTMLVVESGVGYEDIFAKYRVFESYTWMSHVYGLKKIKNGPSYDAVIPNFFDPDDFEFSEQKEDWFLYLGRIVQRKGVEVAVQVTKKIGAKLLIAGQGTLENKSENINITDSHVQHVGFADLEKRKALLSKAKAVFMPTYYIEPFGGVSIEAAMSGTPVISSDWGVFGENILHGITGYRCRTLDHYCWAAENIGNISPKACRDWAVSNFTTDRVAVMYQEYFEMLYDLWGQGWYADKTSRKQLDWLTRSYQSLPSASSSLSTFTSQPASHDSSSLPKIAIWSQLEWAFGRIAENMQKIFANDYSVELFNWREIQPQGTFDRFDLIYVPTWDTRLVFLQLYPMVPPERVICGIHGTAELFNHRFHPEESRAYKVVIQPEIVDAFAIAPELIRYLASIPAIGVVNRTLYERLKASTGLDNLFLTELGVDIHEFEPVPASRSALNVLYPIRIPQNFSDAHGYDAKRFHLIKKLQQDIEKDIPGVHFVIPDGILDNRKMSKFYPSGDVYLCTSHSEGGPLVALEAAACGLAQIATPVGIIPDIVEHGVSGFLLKEKTESEIYEELCGFLSILQKDRERLQDMKIRTRNIIENQWTWTSKKSQWQLLFKSGLTQKYNNDMV